MKRWKDKLINEKMDRRMDKAMNKWTNDSIEGQNKKNSSTTCGKQQHLNEWMK